MQKRMIRDRVLAQAVPEDWLDVVALADVELTSEDAAHPIEGALVHGSGTGWRAEGPGPQTIRLLFRQPQRIRRLRLRFEDAEIERTQEFALRWSPDQGRTYRDIVRQQYTFAPAGATCEVEDLTVDLVAVTALDLTITPDQRGSAYATLAEWRIG